MISLDAYFSDPSVKLRNQLVEENLGLARKAAHSFAKKKLLAYDEAFQLASIGLIKGIERYSPHTGSSSKTGFLLRYCQGEIQHYLRDKSAVIKIPRSLQERISKIKTATTQLSRALHREPTTVEVAKYLNISIEKIEEASIAASSYHQGCHELDFDVISAEVSSHSFSRWLAIKSAIDFVDKESQAAIDALIKGDLAANKELASSVDLLATLLAKTVAP